MPSTSASAVQLAEVLDEDWDLIKSGLFYEASGVLTSVATHHLNLDFATICSGYAEGLSTEDIQLIGEGLLPHAWSVAEQVSAQWVTDVCREDMARSMRGEDVAQPVDGIEPRSEVDVTLALTKPNVMSSGSEQPTPSPVAPKVDAAEPVQ